ncbi:glycosyltransferase family 2 protein [Geobacillus stearothermophilus]|uniref:glycosyltransferase family 2 protein n=1 Tax=Geobacillus stearothermophilus TaxID=1422 RepID=UPI003D2366E3
MKSFPLVYVILLNYNGYKDTIECIESLEKVTYPNMKIVIVDNNSTDGSEQIIKEKFPQHTFIQTGDNLGFAGGNNVGINYALEQGADYVCLLNNDTVVEKDFLDKLVETAEKDETIGIVGGTILQYEDNKKIWYAGGYFNRIGGKAVHIKKLPKQILNEVTFITGCLQLIRRKVLLEVGLLPEEYFLYYEDLDYCMQVRNKGYRLIYDKRAVIYHKCGGTASYKSPISIYYSNRNRLIFYKKYFRGLDLFRYKIIYNILLCIKLLLYRKENRNAIINVYKYNFRKRGFQSEGKKC